MILEFLQGRWHYAIRTFLILFLLDTSPAQAADDQIKAIETYNQGITSLQSGDASKAAEAFQESALTMQDRSAQKQAWFNLGNSLLKLGDAEQALEAYQKARDTQATDTQIEGDANKRISANIALAKKLQMQQMQSKPESGQGEGEGQGKEAQDNGGPKKFQGENLSDAQKQRLYDLVASEERQTQQKLFDKKKNKQTPNSKQW